MNNDESNHSNQGQGAFVRRPIPKYNGDKSGGEEYQSQGGQGGQGGYTPSRYSGGYGGDRQQRDSAQQSSYSNSDRRDGRRSEGGRSGGYNSGGGGGYRGGGGYGYNRSGGGGGYGSNERLIKQNDVIIQLLKDIRERLPAPPGGETRGRRSSNSYSSYSSRSSSYSGGGDDDNNDFDVSDAHNSNAGHSSDLNGNVAEGGADGDEDGFEPGN